MGWIWIEAAKDLNAFSRRETEKRRLPRDSHPALSIELDFDRHFPKCEIDKSMGISGNSRKAACIRMKHP